MITSHLLPFFAAIVFGILGWAGYQNLEHSQQKSAEMARLAQLEEAPFTQWMNVSSIFVYDGTIENPPAIDYTRNIKQPFTANWEVDVQRLVGTKFVDVCHGNGKSNYVPGEDQEKVRHVSFEWFTGIKNCTLGPGEYRLLTHWIINLSGVSPKSKINTSNVFKITDG